MPVISPRRLSTTTGSSSYLPPSVGGTTSSLSNLGKSSALSGLGSTYRRSSLTNSSSAYTSSYSSGGSNLSSYLPRTSYRSSLYSSSSYGNSGTTSSYRTSSYLTGGNNDTTAASRFGVSSNRYTRSGSDRESTIRKTSSSTHLNNNNNTTTTATNRLKTLNSKPPIGIGSSTSSIRSTQQCTDSRSRDNSTTRTSSDNNLTYVTSKSDLNNSNSSSQSKLQQQQQQQNNSNSSSSNSNGSNYNSNCNNNTNSNCNKPLSLISSSSTSSLARQVATSGLELYEKYSPAHYTPKCELARSRSLSEATSKRYNNINNNNNDINYNDNNCIIDKNLSNSSGNVQQLLQSKDNAISKLSRQDSTTSGSSGAIVNNTSSSNNNCKTSSPSPPPPSSSIKITTANSTTRDKDKDKDNTNATQLANKVNELCADNKNAIINNTTTANAATTTTTTTITSSVVFSTTTPHTATNIINNTNNNKILIKNINSNYQNRQTVASSVVVINHNHNNNNSAANTIIANNSSSPLKQNTLQINNILVRHCVSDTTDSDFDQNTKKFENNSNGYNTIFDLNAKYIPFTALSTGSGTVGSPGKRTTFGGTSSGFNTIATLGSRSANSSPSASRRVPRVTTVEINRSSDQINDRDLSGDRFSATDVKFFASTKESQFYSTEPPSQITATFPVPVPLPLTHPVATTSTSSASASESPSAGFVKNFANKINHSEHSNLCKSSKNHHQSIANHQLLSSQNSATTNPVTNCDQLRRSTAATTIISKAVNSENLTPTHSVATSRDKDKISIASEQQTSLIDTNLGQLNSFDRNLKVTQKLITKSGAGGKLGSLATEPGILESPATTVTTSSNNKNHSSQLASNLNTNSRNKNSINGNGINKLQLTGKNTNALLQAAKLNLKSTKQFLSNKFDDKTMTNTFSSTCCTQNLNNNNNNNNNNTINTTTKSVSSSLLSIKPTTTINKLTNDTKSTTNTNHTNNKLNSTTSAKSFFNHIDKNNLLDIRLDFTKSRIRSDDEGGANGITKRDPATSSSAASSIRSAVGSILGGNTAKTVNNHNGIVPQLSSYKDQNFLKCEYELARSQLVNSNESDQQNENYTKDSLDSTINNNLNRKLNNNNNTNNNNNNKSDSNIVKNSNHEKGNKCGKNLIRPLIHKTSNIKIADKLSKLINKNNMNCLQSSPDLLDDIKFIDSDDSERHQIQQTQPQSISSGLSNVLPPEVTKSPVRTTEPTVVAETTTASITKSDFAYGKPTRNVSNSTISQLTSTLPLTSKQQRDLTNNTNNPSYSNINNSRGSTAIKYNTLNDFKRIPTSNLSNTSYGVFNNHHHHPHHHHHVVNSSSDLSANNRPASATASNSPTTVSSNSMQLPPLQHHRSSSASPSQSMMMANHSYCTSSRESTPSSSPQLLRRRNLLNGSSTSVLINQQPQSVHHLQPPQQQQQSLQAHTQPATAGNENNFSSSSASSSSSSLMTDKKLSTKICDIDESVRNASIRSALPSSPTPSRYWDREGRSSTLSSRNINDSDDYISTKSTSDYDKTISSENSEGLCGLRNIGNTCFMNSVIQCLSHTRELTKFLKNQVNVKSSSKDQQILCEFSKLIRDMWKPNTRSMTPLELKSAFSSKHRMYSGYNQQDAQEFLRFFLDSLHSALNTGSKGGELKIDDCLSDNKKADLTWEWYSRIENSIIRDLFVGQLKSTLKCTTCGNTSVTFDPFWDLSVPLPSSSRCKLDACLDLFIREEVLDGDEMPTCSKCQTRRKCTKSFTIQRFPKYLVIHLKRFSETRWSKLSNVVEFPTGERELNMGPYAASPTTTASYTLYAISNHMGCTAGGHYVALCRHPASKKWHEFNDNVVSDDLSDSTLVSSSAYLLFYERS